MLPQIIKFMRVLITGADGFLGKNLQLRLRERKDISVRCFTRKNPITQLPELVKDVDFVFHLAGVNRPENPQEFVSGNTDLTLTLCQYVEAAAHKVGKPISILFSSSIQATLENAYGRSKLEAEQVLVSLGQDALVPTFIYRLPNVFGKWCRPNYNSVVATFCHNISHNLPIKINDSSAPMTLVYIDDVIDSFVNHLDVVTSAVEKNSYLSVKPQYQITVGDLAKQIQAFKESRKSLKIERVGLGLMRALYATYVSYLPKESFNYELPQHIDQRGSFVEILKTPDCGQFSCFTVFPGMVRGGHYHDSKTEKFLVLKGKSRFRFRHMLTGETHEFETCGEVPQIVETIPGWTHDIANIGNTEMIVVLWANEIYDPNRPDTYKCPI